jgi:hypothetical protein
VTVVRGRPQLIKLVGENLLRGLVLSISGPPNQSLVRRIETNLFLSAKDPRDVIPDVPSEFAGEFLQKTTDHFCILP